MKSNLLLLKVSIILIFTGCAKKSFEVERGQLATYADRLKIVQKTVAVANFSPSWYGFRESLDYQDIVIDSLGKIKNELTELSMPDDSTARIHRYLIAVSEINILSCRAYIRSLKQYYDINSVLSGRYRRSMWEFEEAQTAWHLRDSSKALIKIVDSLLYRVTSPKVKS